MDAVRMTNGSLNETKDVELKINENEVKLVGRLVRNKWGKLYNKSTGYVTALLEVERQSGVIDTIPVKIGRGIARHEEVDELEGKEIYIQGKMVSFNREFDEKKKLIVMVGVDVITEDIPEDLTTNNYVRIEGTISNEPTFRKTPLKRYITELILSSNLSKSYSVNVPCIFWSKLAVKIAELKQGDAITVIGRFQSRDYSKKLPNGETITKTTYELSAQSVEGIEP